MRTACTYIAFPLRIERRLVFGHSVAHPHRNVSDIALFMPLHEKVHSPMSRNRSLLITIGLGLLGGAIAFAAIFHSLILQPGSFDDGMQLSAAMFWLRGQTPNVDFYSVYPPLNCYLIGTAFRIFGESVVAYRIVQTAAYAFIVGASALLASARIRGPWLATAIVAVLALNIASADLQAVTALMWSTLATVLVLEGRGHPGPTGRARLIIAGFCVAALAFTRLNFALYFMFAFTASAIVEMTAGRARRGARRPLRDFVYLVIPAAVVTVVLYFIWGGSLVSLINQIAIMPSKANAAYAFSPMPAHLVKLPFSFSFYEALAAGLPPAWLAFRAAEESDETGSRRLWGVAAAIVLWWFALGRWLPVALPIIVPVLFLIIIATAYRLARLPPEEIFLLLLLASQEHYILGRPDPSHLLSIFPLLGILFVIGVDAAQGTGSLMRMRMIGLVLAVCTTTVAFFMFGAVAYLAKNYRTIGTLKTMLRSNDEEIFGRCGAECNGFRVDTDEIAAVSMIREHAAPDDAVYSGFQNNHRGTLNDLRAYWLLRRPPGTRYTMLLKGFTDKPDQELQIANDLHDRRVGWLILTAPSGPTVPFEQGESLLDDYIHAQYQREARFGGYEVWRLK